MKLRKTLLENNQKNVHATLYVMQSVTFHVVEFNFSAFFKVASGFIFEVPVLGRYIQLQNGRREIGTSCATLHSYSIIKIY